MLQALVDIAAAVTARAFLKEEQVIASFAS
jgi:hypothetical protein